MHESNLSKEKQVMNKLRKCKISRLGNADSIGNWDDLFTQEETTTEPYREVRGHAAVQGLTRWTERMHQILARKFILDPRCVLRYYT